MKKNKLKSYTISAFLLLYIFIAIPNFGQDAAKVDSNHYKVVFENSEMRVLHIEYGPGEKSVMHHHPEGLAIFITDGDVKFTYPGGKTNTIKVKAGQVIWLSEETHLPQNMGNKKFELYQIEMKPTAPQPSEEVDNRHRPQG